MLRIFKFFLIILPLLLILGLNQGCDKDNGGGTTGPTDTGTGTGTTTDTGTGTGTGDTGGGTTTFAVTSVTASVDPPSYTGTCPKTFNFSAVISANGPGTVTYKWERSDGVTSPTGSITFDTAGSKTVTSAWDLSSNGTWWMRLRILTPNEMVSNQATFTLSCVVAQPDIAVASRVTVSDTRCGTYRDWGIDVVNVGAGTLSISSANITAGGSWFSKIDDSCSGRTLSRDAHCTIGIRFSPPIPGCPAEYYGTLRIISNDPDEGTVYVNLVGRGI
jgi:hypothetical protein